MNFTVTIDEDFIQSKLEEYSKKVINEIMSDWDFKGDLTRQIKSQMKSKVVPIIESECADIDILRSEIKDRVFRALAAQITKKIKEEVGENEL